MSVVSRFLVAVLICLAMPARAEAPTDAVRDVATFLRDYTAALAKKDQAWLAAHVVFPLAVSYIDYDMEAKTKKVTVRDAKALVTKANLLELGDDLKKLLASGAAPEALLVGELECVGGGGGVNMKKGPPAIAVTGAEATVTFIVEPCAAETHLGLLKLKKGPAGWRVAGFATKSAYAR